MNINIRKKATFMLLLLSLAFTGHSQTISFIQRIYQSTEDYNADPDQNSLKVLAYKKNTKMTLSRDIIDYHFRLSLFTPNKLSPIEMRFPEKYKISDFDILGDTVYFAGQEGDSNCFLAYFNINSMINAGNTAVNIPIKYTLIGNSANEQYIYKIKAFKNDAGERIVAGIGNFYYRDLAYMKPVFGPTGSYLEWVNPQKHRHSYVMFYHITEENYTNDGTGDLSVLGTTGNKVNSIEFYRNPLNNNKPLDYAELFADITTTDKYVCILSHSVSSSDTLWSASSSFGNRLILRTFDKNTLQRTGSRYLLIKDSLNHNMEFLSGPSSLHITHTLDNYVAVSYAYVNYQYHDTVRFAVDKINLSDTAYKTVSSIISDEIFYSFELIGDITFNSLSNQVMTLIRDSSNNRVYQLQLKENTPANSTNKYFILDNWAETEQKTRPFWTNLNVDSNFYMTAIGVDCDDFSILLANKNIQNISWKCLQFKNGSIKEWKDKTRPWLTMPNLVRCNFATGYNTGTVELGNNTRITRISSFSIQAKRGKSMITKCN